MATVYTHSYKIEFSDAQKIEGEVVFNSNRTPCISIGTGAELTVSEMQLFHLVMDGLTALFKLSGGFSEFEVKQKG